MRIPFFFWPDRIKLLHETFSGCENWRTGLSPPVCLIYFSPRFLIESAKVYVTAEFKFSTLTGGGGGIPEKTDPGPWTPPPRRVHFMDWSMDYPPLTPSTDHPIKKKERKKEIKKKPEETKNKNKTFYLPEAEVVTSPLVRYLERAIS